MARPQEFDTEQALNQAVELFWRNGYGRTSLNDLLAQMHIRRSSFYNTFGDKHTLFVQALARYLQVANDDFIVARLNAQASGLEGIRQVLRGIVGSLTSDPERKGCLMVNTQTEVARSDETIRQMIGQSLDRMQTALTAALKRSQAAGEIRAELDAESAAKFLVSTIVSLRAMGCYSNNPQDLEPIAAMALALIDR